jgi:hypothetical protein
MFQDSLMGSTGETGWSRWVGRNFSSISRMIRSPSVGGAPTMCFGEAPSSRRLVAEGTPVSLSCTYAATFPMNSRTSGTFSARTTAQKTNTWRGNFFVFDLSMIISRHNSALEKSLSTDLRLASP